MSWLAQYFLNPGFVIPGLALASIPIIIHILSRLRYRKIRFAAMEFLLQSDELNRRRLILEQLLLLLLRILAVLLIMFLLARLILDPSRLLMLRGASVHHIVILDDSLSMRDRVDSETVFSEAIRTLEQMLAQGGERSGAARVTVLTMTDPSRAIVSDRQLDSGLLQEITGRLRGLRCSFRGASPVAALTTAQDILAADGGVSPQVHVITDLRTTDWTGRPEVAAALDALKSIDADVSLVRVARESHNNVALEALTSDSLAIAQGVPWRMNLVLRNYGTNRVSELRGTVLVDGTPLPASVLIPELEPDTSVTVSHDVTFQIEGRHQVEVRLNEDSLVEDNRRFIAVEVTDRRPVLIVDDEGQQEDAGYVAAALSADEKLTGLSVDIRTSQSLSGLNLSGYDCIYLLNIRDLPADTSILLADYVREGGGIIWFPGEQANTQWYSGTLREPQLQLFPVPLGVLRVPVSGGRLTDSAAASESAANDTFQSPVFEQHPIFMVYNVPDSPFADAIRMDRWLQVSEDWVKDDSQRNDGVRTLVRMKNGDPVAFQHQLGKGRILTFLTGAGRRWSNWPIAPAAPGYVVMHLLIHPWLQKPADGIEIRELAEPLVLQWPAGKFQENVEVFLPEAETDEDAALESFVRMQATAVKESPPESASEKSEEDTQSDAGESLMSVTVTQANRPGLCRIRRFTADGSTVDTWIALNVVNTESRLAVAEPEQITSQAGMDHVRVLESAAVASLGGNESGRELRWLLLGLLVAVLTAEQLLALHMSYHPEDRR